MCTSVMLAFSFRNISEEGPFISLSGIRNPFSKGLYETVLAFAGHMGSFVVAHLPLILDLCDDLCCTATHLWAQG